MSHTAPTAQSGDVLASPRRPPPYATLLVGSSTDTIALSKIGGNTGAQTSSSRSSTCSRPEHNRARVPAKDHLAAIYADPSDAAARSVYGDFLQAKGDPQGELVALQLARAAGQPGDPARERALIAKHRDAFAGALGKRFRNHVFEGGIFAGGILKTIKKADVNRVLRDPAWAAIRLVARDSTWATGVDVEDLIDRPELANVRAVYELRSAAAVAFATGTPRPWTELGLFDTVSTSEHDALGTCSALPDLTTLALWIDAATIPWIASAPVFRRLQRLIVLENSGFDQLLAAAVDLPGIRELVLCTHRGPLFAANEWTLRFQRDRAPGPFTRIRGHYVSGPGTSPGFGLRSLQQVDVAPLTSVVLEAGRCKLAPDAKAFVTKLLARFANVPEVKLPFS